MERTRILAGQAILATIYHILRFAFLAKPIRAKRYRGSAFSRHKHVCQHGYRRL
jgi:hypothetical protein